MLIIDVDSRAIEHTSANRMREVYDDMKERWSEEDMVDVEWPLMEKITHYGGYKKTDIIVEKDWTIKLGHHQVAKGDVMIRRVYPCSK